MNELIEYLKVINDNIFIIIVLLFFFIGIVLVIIETIKFIIKKFKNDN